MIFDLLYESVAAGGWIMFPLFLVGAAGFFLLLLTYGQLGADLWRGKEDRFNMRVMLMLEAGRTDEVDRILKSKSGILSESLRMAWDNRHLGLRRLKPLLNEKLDKRVGSLGRHLPSIEVLAASAPLLGLLGTVTGMVHTFQIISEYGNSNPILLADGISEALITTQSGLILAFPLVLFKHRLEDRIAWLRSQIESGLTMMLNQLQTMSQSDSENPPDSNRSN